jgi:hypothetical protein
MTPRGVGKAARLWRPFCGDSRIFVKGREER